MVDWTGASNWFQGRSGRAMTRGAVGLWLIAIGTVDVGRWCAVATSCADFKSAVEDSAAGSYWCARALSPSPRSLAVLSHAVPRAPAQVGSAAVLAVRDRADVRVLPEHVALP